MQSTFLWEITDQIASQLYGNIVVIFYRFHSRVRAGETTNGAYLLGSLCYVWCSGKQLLNQVLSVLQNKYPQWFNIKYGNTEIHSDFKMADLLGFILSMLPWLSGRICILKVLLLWAWKINNKLELKQWPLNKYTALMK